MKIFLSILSIEIVSKNPFQVWFLTLLLYPIKFISLNHIFRSQVAILESMSNWHFWITVWIFKIFVVNKFFLTCTKRPLINSFLEWSHDLASSGHKVDIEFQRKLLVLTEFFNFFDIFTSAGMPKNNNKKLHIFIALVL